MYAVGVGRAADIAELQEIASEPEYVYTSPSFKDLQSITSEIRRQFCDGKCLFLPVLRTSSGSGLPIIYSPKMLKLVSKLIKIARNHMSRTNI